MRSGFAHVAAQAAKAAPRRTGQLASKCLLGASAYRSWSDPVPRNDGGFLRKLGE